ncbi:MAG: mechanosensitive ion channel family protein [Deltaproteobacteria bacterium]|uniref:Mechanosensitive ion channel family protein n=1 Tax=Candidatus Zymogenus saltonus TaxID=2844893 RepID=A0A9D8KES3_9DELT|nr:mechanosensitive ion channel family protein [Candidatus Zymogenus saltonus]
MVDWIIPFLFIFGGLVIGILFEKFILKRIERILEKTPLETDHFIIKAFKGMSILIFVTIGIYLAVVNIHASKKIRAVLDKALIVIIILVITIVAARIAVGFIEYYTKKIGKVFPSSSIFTNITYVVILSIGFLIILDYLGVSITPLLTALGVGGLAAALALQDTLANVFSGIHIIASGKVKPGDYIMLSSGEEGYVHDITWRNTTIRALRNNMIIVPNQKLSSSIITNYSHPETEMSVLYEVGVSYDSDLEFVEKVTVEVARETLDEVEGGVSLFEPLIRYNSFGDSSIKFNVILRVTTYEDQYRLKHEFIKRLHVRYKKEGIEIPFPITTINIHEKQ